MYVRTYVHLFPIAYEQSTIGFDKLKLFRQSLIITTMKQNCKSIHILNFVNEQNYSTICFFTTVCKSIKHLVLLRQFPIHFVNCYDHRQCVKFNVNYTKQNNDFQNN